MDLLHKEAYICCCIYSSVLYGNPTTFSLKSCMQEELGIRYIMECASTSVQCHTRNMGTVSNSYTLKGKSLN